MSIQFEKSPLPLHNRAIRSVTMNNKNTWLKYLVWAGIGIAALIVFILTAK